MAVAVLKKVQDMVTAEQGAITIQALPLVGLGRAYENAGFSVIGCTQVMPSGGFIYMDGKQLLGDVRAGLLSLTLSGRQFGCGRRATRAAASWRSATCSRSQSRGWLPRSLQGGGCRPRWADG